jgi:hypothetical protein
MRLEGRSGDCERSSEKRDVESTTAARPYDARSRLKMYDRLHLPARLVPRHV